MIITKTPFRISFFGGGTDYPEWFRENHGAVLSTSIDKYGYITCRYLPPFFDYKYRISYSLTELVRRLDDIQHPAVRAGLKFIGLKAGVEIHYDGDIPAKTGMGSSSSFTVGLLKSLYALQGKMINNMELGLQAIHVERDLIPENVGCQDQLAAALGGFNLMEFGPGDKIVVRPLILRKERLEFFRSHLLLMFTGFSRYSSLIAGELVKTGIKKRKKELRSIHQMVPEALKLLNTGDDVFRDLTDIGKMLHESWMIKRGLVTGITTREIDEIYTTARKSGAIGGKILGAGGGGCILFFVSPENHVRLRRALSKLLHVPFQFESHGSQVVYFKQDEYDQWAPMGSQDRRRR